MISAPLQSLNNFFLSVQNDNPELAEVISPDVEIVALCALAAPSNRQIGQDAADRLRRVAFDLSIAQARVLGYALDDFGF